MIFFINLFYKICIKVCSFCNVDVALEKQEEDRFLAQHVLVNRKCSQPTLLAPSAEHFSLILQSKVSFYFLAVFLLCQFQ